MEFFHSALGAKPPRLTDEKRGRRRPATIREHGEPAHDAAVPFAR